MSEFDEGQDVVMRRRHRDQPFVAVPTQTVLDCRMKPDALGVLTYMLMRSSIPGGWRFRIREVARHFNCGSTGKRISSAMQDLEALGYLERLQVRDDRGRVCGMEYIVDEISESAVPWSAEMENGVLDDIESRTRFSGSRKTVPRETDTTKKEDKQKEEKQKDLLSASADGLRQEQQKAKTENVKRKEQTPTVKAPTPQQLMPFLAAWNENRNPARMSQHRGLDRDQTALLQQMVAGHGGDLDAALATWTLAVQKLAAVDTRQPTNWWGDPSQPKRGLANAARHWSKHAVEHKPSAAAVKAQPAYDKFELDDEEI